MSGILWNPLTGKYENQTPTTTDNKTTPYSKEPISTATPMRCTKCGRITTELHTDFAYPEEHLCPDCSWQRNFSKTTISVTESKEERCYKKLKKWLKKQGKKCETYETHAATLQKVRKKIIELESEQ